MYEIYEVC